MAFQNESAGGGEAGLAILRIGTAPHFSCAMAGRSSRCTGRSLWRIFPIRSTSARTRHSSSLFFPTSSARYCWCWAYGRAGQHSSASATSWWRGRCYIASPSSAGAWLRTRRVDRALSRRIADAGHYRSSAFSVDRMRGSSAQREASYNLPESTSDAIGHPHHRARCLLPLLPHRDSGRLSRGTLAACGPAQPGRVGTRRTPLWHTHRLVSDRRVDFYTAYTVIAVPAASMGRAL